MYAVTYIRVFDDIIITIIITDTITMAVVVLFVMRRPFVNKLHNAKGDVHHNCVASKVGGQE